MFFKKRIQTGSFGELIKVAGFFRCELKLQHVGSPVEVSFEVVDEEFLTNCKKALDVFDQEFLEIEKNVCLLTESYTSDENEVIHFGRDTHSVQLEQMQFIENGSFNSSWAVRELENDSSDYELTVHHWQESMNILGFSH